MWVWDEKPRVLPKESEVVVVVPMSKAGTPGLNAHTVTFCRELLLSVQTHHEPLESVWPLRRTRLFPQALPEAD